MKTWQLICLLLLRLPVILSAQLPTNEKNNNTSCGQNEITERLFKDRPEIKQFQQQAELLIREYNRRIAMGELTPQQSNGIVTLPVVVHIIHNNGSENISDARVFSAIQHLNEAFANTGYYDPADGVNTQIQFCLAQRDPQNNPTNGINRIVSPLTVMDGWNNTAEDLAVKNLSRWDPRCYINIWIVKEIIGGVAGYAYLPSAHGMNIDGIVGEAAYIGSSNANDVLIIHEMGHYLGLYHTFQGACKNDDCTKDGDQVCDTPPDQSTAGISCNSTANSCSTDVQSGFSTDENDLHTDYLDYGNWNCMKVFTQGQAERMNWMINNIRKSLLACKSCMVPCPTPVTANFNSSANNISVGTSVNFTNSSTSATGQHWYINNVLQSSSTNFSFTFNTVGTFIIKLSALTSNPLCDSAEKYDTIKVTCPVVAAFTPTISTTPLGSTVNFINSSAGAVGYTWLVNNIAQAFTTNFSYTFAASGYYTIKLLAVNSNCSDSVMISIGVNDTLPPVPNDTCGNNTFQEIISGTGEDVALDIKVLNDGSYLMVGHTTTTSIGYAQVPSALYMNISPKGQIIWQKKITGGATNAFSKILITKAGERIIFGNSNSQHNANGSMLVTKIDNTGNVVWAKEYDFRNASHSGFLSVDDVIELPNGDFALCGTATGINTDVGQPMPAAFNIITVLRSDGSLRWVRRFREYYTESGGKSLAITHLNNYLFVSTDYGIMKLTVSDGTPTGLNKKFFSLGGFFSLETSGSNVLASSGLTRTLFDQSLNVISCWRISNPDLSYSLGMSGTGAENASTSQGSMMRAPSRTDRNLFLAKILNMNTVIWSYRYPFVGTTDIRFLEHARTTPDNGIVSSGSAYREIPDSRNGPKDILLIRTDSLGNINECPRSTAAIEINPFNDFSYLELHARTYPLTPIMYTLNLQPLNADLAVQQFCRTQNCDALTLTKTDMVCKLSDTLKIFATRSRDCDAFTKWIVDSSTARIAYANDSVLAIQFKSDGIFSVKARIQSGCKILEDSTLITVFNAPDSLSLGPDIQLCKISTHTLNAGTGFKSYLWQDGSVDSTLSIFQPGTYHVIAEDFCGNLYKDTVVVSQAPDIPFELGADKEICLNDSATIVAPGGFNKYYWSPSYNINNAYTPAIKVSPEKDTTYVVIAEKGIGCLVTDSIRIKVNRPDSLYLGNDTSICSGNSISINANAGYNTYLWNTGASSASIQTGQKGLYSVTATNNKGCVSKDSIEIKNVYSLPVVSLGNDFSICRDQQHTFNAGNFSSYLWQDGSSTRSITTSLPGNYWVRVTDNNGCTNGDSVSIVSVNELPSGFLDNEALICVGQRFELKSNSAFTKYKWFNNASASSVIVTAPGSYWLEVTSADGCIARDTIMVNAKDCLKGVFFPNAFTPFNGGANNYFRPIVYGQLESFYMVVFNRYGQKVFETRNAQQGWNGLVNGQPQNTNSFTWSATFRFTGESIMKTEKGVVTLVR